MTIQLNEKGSGYEDEAEDKQKTQDVQRSQCVQKLCTHSVSEALHTPLPRGDWKSLKDLNSRTEVYSGTSPQSGSEGKRLEPGGSDRPELQVKVDPLTGNMPNNG